MSVHIVINRQARHLDDESPVRRALLAEAERHGAAVHETRSLAELGRIAEGIAEGRASAVVLAGGDGSHMAGVSALARVFAAGAMPPLALAPGGTVGVVARNLAAGHGAARDRAATLVRAVCEGTARPTSTPTLRVRDDAGGDHVAFIFGAGLVARFFDVYDAAPRQGVGPAAVLAARAFFGSLVGSPFARRMLSPVACALRVDGALQPSRAWSLLLASVVPDVGLGVRATYRAGQEPDRFHVIASARSPRGLAAQVPRVLAGRAMTGAGHVDTLARRLEVTFEGGQGGQGGPGDDSGATYVLDGDALRARQVAVEAGPVVSLLVAGERHEGRS